MAHEGTLIWTDAKGEEHRARVSGDLELYQEGDGRASIQGVLHVAEDRVPAVRDVMEAQGEDGDERPRARYTGEMVDAQGGGTRPVTDVPMYVMEVYENGNVRVRSTAAEA